MIKRFEESNKDMEDLEILQDPDYKSPDFILQNLSFVGECYEDSSYLLTTRSAIFEIISYQISFFCMCALKGLVGRDIAPSILVCGAGRLGSKVIQSLVDCGCGPLLKIYSRGEVHLRSWKKRGFTCSSSISALILGHNPDVVIICSNLSGFPQLCSDLTPYMSSSVFVISATFGLQLKRIYHMLKTPGVFRTYTDPSKLRDLANATNTAPFQPYRHTSFLREIFQQVSAESTHGATNTIEYAASCLLDSPFEVKNMLLILENYFAILGMAHNVAREEAISVMLGNTDPPADHEPQTLQPFMAPEAKGTSASPTKSKPFQLLDSVLKLLKDKVGTTFQKELSKKIRVIDLPVVPEYSDAKQDSSFVESAAGGRRSSLYPFFKERKKGKFTYLELALLAEGRGQPEPTIDEATLIRIFESDLPPVEK